jgi:hypothetical protein
MINNVKQYSRLLVVGNIIPLFVTQQQIIDILSPQAVRLYTQTEKR